MLNTLLNFFGYHITFVSLAQAKSIHEVMRYYYNNYKDSETDNEMFRSLSEMFNTKGK